MPNKGIRSAVTTEIKKAQALGHSVDMAYLIGKLSFSKYQVSSCVHRMVQDNMLASIRTGDGYGTIYSLNLAILTKRSLPRSTKSCMVTYPSGKKVPYLYIAAALDAIGVPFKTYSMSALRNPGQPLKFKTGHIIEVGDYNQ